MRGKDVGFAILFVIVIALAAQFIVPQLFDSGATHPTGKATQASFSICINDPPRLNYSACNLSIAQNKYYICPLSAYDYDGTTNFTFYALNVSGALTFNVTPAGVLIAQPGDDLVGFHNINLLAVDTSGCVNNVDSELVTFEVVNVNDPPVFIPPLGPLEWELGTTLRSIYMGNYFIDPDGDAMTYSLSTIPSGFLVSLGDFGELILSATVCGDGFITVTATDTFNASTTSDPVSISAPCIEESSSSGGGSGPGNSCVSNWKCSDWGICYQNGTQKKICKDLSQCEDEPLVLWRDCTYVPECQNGVWDLTEEGVDCGGSCPICLTCSDGIQNQGELGVDCGGPCSICKSCFDGIQNFQEEGVDCGGGCPACATCFDGIQNQDESGVDCGGSCPACTILQTPTPVHERSNPLIPWILGIVATIATLALIYRMFYKKIHQIIAKIILFFLKKANKAILLTAMQRDSLLGELAALEKRQLLANNHKEERAQYQDAISALYRKMFVVILGPVFTLDDAEAELKSMQTISKTVKHLLQKQYIQLMSLEQDAVMSSLRLQLHTELFRQRIFGFSSVDKSITSREVKTKMVKGSSVEQVETLLYNVSLALQFGNIVAARQNYLEALTIYDALTAPEQSLLFGLLHLTFDDIRYVAAYSK